MTEFEEKLHEWHDLMRRGAHQGVRGRALAALLKARLPQLGPDHRLRAQALMLKLGRPFDPDEG